MRIALVCFTERGFETEKKIAKICEKAGYETVAYVSGKYALQAASKDHGICFSAVPEGKLSQWAKERWEDAKGLIFIGACGIAVRAVGPHIRDKFTDPAVISVDEKAEFVIPLLSGHMGGANELAQFLAKELGACPVVTTATDLEEKFAVDVFAKSRGLSIDDRVLAKEVSADILAGEPVGLFSDFGIDGPVPEGLFYERICRRNIWITMTKKELPGVPAGRILRLIPRCAAVGIGCRRGTPEEKIREELERAFGKNGVDLRSVCMVSSIDLKAGEPGIVELSRKLKIPFFTYSGEELLEIPGEFTESEFVQRTTGVGNVCERAAMAACMEGAADSRLLFRKYAADGVTVAAAYFSPRLFRREP